MPRAFFLEGTKAGEEMTFEDFLLLGRSKKVNCVLDDPRVSAEHCLISQDEGQWWVTDLGSKNGVYLNETKVNKEPIKTGDHIRVGRTLLRFVLE